MRKHLLLPWVVLVLSAPAAAQETPKWEFFGGFSYLNADFTFTDTDHYGLQMQLARNFNENFGIVFDYGAQSGDADIYAWTVGPRFFRRGEKATGFMHVLIGTAYAPDAPYQNAFVIGAGGGVEVALTDQISYRAIQLEYFATDFTDDWEDNVRFGAGITYRFGGELGFARASRPLGKAGRKIARAFKAFARAR